MVSKRPKKTNLTWSIHFWPKLFSVHCYVYTKNCATFAGIFFRKNQLRLFFSFFFPTNSSMISLSLWFILGSISDRLHRGRRDHGLHCADAGGIRTALGGDLTMQKMRIKWNQKLCHKVSLKNNTLKFDIFWNQPLGSNKFVFQRPLPAEWLVEWMAPKIHHPAAWDSAWPPWPRRTCLCWLQIDGWHWTFRCLWPSGNGRKSYGKLYPTNTKNHPKFRKEKVGTVATFRRFQSKYEGRSQPAGTKALHWAWRLAKQAKDELKWQNEISSIH